MENVTKSTSAVPVTGIILAGGQSSRMGQDKGLLTLHSRTLIEIAIQNLEEVCGEIIISSGSDLYAGFGKQIIRDLIPGIGPMGGLYSALKHSKTDKNLLLSVDMPFVTKELLTPLVQNSDGFFAAVPWFGGERYEPLCACYDLSMLPYLEAFISERNYKLPDVYNQVSIHKLLIDENLPFYRSYLFHNINTPSDLNSALDLLTST